MELDMQKLEPLLGKMVTEAGAAANASLVLLGDKLGLFRALSADGPLTSTELAKKTGTNERYVREWLSAQAATGFIDYDPSSGSFSMSPEQAALLANPDGPLDMTGVFYMAASVHADEPKLADAFRSGAGIRWEDHCNCLFCGTGRSSPSGYKPFLLSAWLPALDGVVDKLKRGARVADVGCGYGGSTEMMAGAFPNSEFIGFDFHEASIAHAREHNGRANVRFETARAQDYDGRDFDLVTIFDALHDMGDPVGAARHIRRTLKPDGTLMLVEPLAGDRLEDNFNPVGRLCYAASTAICVPASLDQEVGAALGAQAGEKRLAKVAREAGFTRFRRVAETPTTMVLEARP